MITTQINNKICKKCHKNSVLSQGNWERCQSCGEVYSKRSIEVATLEDIVLDTHIDRRVKYLNKMFFFLSA